MSKPEYHVASFSGGKDSTAMVLHMIERGDHLDEVLCCDTTIEFPAMYRHIEKVKKVVEAAGIKFTILRPPHNFEYYLSEVDAPNRKPTSNHFGVPGYGWPGPKIRWCTKHLKLELITNYLKKLRETYEVIQYIGLAADEDYRMERENNQDPNHRHALREWGWTEAVAMQFCRDRGYDWEGLYDILRDKKTGRARVSCWCCPLQGQGKMRILRRHFPDLWQELLRLDAKQWQTFNHGYTVADFDRRFDLEDKLTAAGESIKNKAFFKDLKRLLSEEVTAEDILIERTEKRRGEQQDERNRRRRQLDAVKKLKGDQKND